MKIYSVLACLTILIFRIEISSANGSYSYTCSNDKGGLGSVQMIGREKETKRPEWTCVDYVHVGYGDEYGHCRKMDWVPKVFLEFDVRINFDFKSIALRDILTLAKVKAEPFEYFRGQRLIKKDGEKNSYDLEYDPSNRRFVVFYKDYFQNVPYNKPRSVEYFECK